MKILVIGDIVGSPGRQAVKIVLAKLKSAHQLELVVANAENAAGGSGLTPTIIRELLSSGIDVITTGDHVWKKKDILESIDTEPRLLRPANYPDGVPGKGSVVVEGRTGIKIGVINLLGRVFMAPLECPFKTAKEEVAKIKKETKIIIVDIHAEATSEKIALGWYLDGLVSAVVGTHTHVQTADQRVLPAKTAYISDLGMTGPIDSVLGRRREQVLERFITSMPVRFQMADENIQLQGAMIDINPQTGQANSIERIIEKV